MLNCYFPSSISASATNGGWSLAPCTLFLFLARQNSSTALAIHVNSLMLRIQVFFPNFPLSSDFARRFKLQKPIRVVPKLIERLNYLLFNATTIEIPTKQKHPNQITNVGSNAHNLKKNHTNLGPLPFFNLKLSNHL